MSTERQTVYQRSQVTAEQIKTMTPEQILEAQERGRLNTLLGRPEPSGGTPDGQ
ncbi:hypothetical protein V3C33_13745 [Micrococcaceae bacterium Sec5.7]